jgi:hypothetical protein
MRTYFIKKSFPSACTFLVLSLLCCVDEYNPFEDNFNAQSHILKSTYSDSIPMFTTDNIELLFTVCNLIEKVNIRAEKNRYFESRTIKDACKNNGRILVPVSFYDTGKQEISIVTYRENGDSVVLKKQYRVVSTYKPCDIAGKYGDSLRLIANANNKNQDKDIQYYWSIGSVKKITPPSDTSFVIVKQQDKIDSGQLVICSSIDTFRSSPITFKVFLTDPAPKIVIADGFDSDTLYTGSDSINLRVNIDKYLPQVSVTVNGQEMANDSSPNTFVKVIKKTGPQIQKLTITVTDQKERQFNRDVYVEFNSQRKQIVKTELVVWEMGSDKVVNMMRQIDTLEGSVNFNANTMMNYTVSLFEKDAFVDSFANYGNSSFDWKFGIILKNEKTVFRIELSDNTGNLLDYKSLVVNYCDSCKDSVPPVKRSIQLVNGYTLMSSDHYVSNQKDIKFEVIYYDVGGVNAVFMNNVLMTRVNNKWFADAVVGHITNPGKFTFYAVDKSDNRSSIDTIIAGFDTPPNLYTYPDSIDHAFTGRLYTADIEIVDKDVNDFITYSLHATGIRNISIDERGTVKWTPEKGDVGFHPVTITGVDRGGKKISYTYTIYVSETALDTVKFVTSRSEFPKLLSCTDSINIPLKVRGGTKPFIYKVVNRTKNKFIAVDPVQPYFKWKPDCGIDTGAHQFFIVVRDTLRLSDTLWPVVNVFPQNRDYEVKEIRWSGSRKPDSALDLSRNRTDTLYFLIKDADNPLYERHTIDVISGVEKYTITTDSGKFLIPLSHLAKVSGRDSLVLTISDKGNHVKRITKKLDYGKPPLTPVLLKPNNDTVIESKDMQFRWSCADPDGEQLKYHFTLQFIDGTFQVNKDLLDTFCMVTGLKKAGEYFWSVIASDSKSTAGSLTRKIICLPPDRVRIDTTVSKLPQIISCKTSIKAPVVVKNGYPPFTYKCSPPFVIKGDSIVWSADCNKTGSYNIDLVVNDSVGNTDSYTFNTSVYGSDSLGLRIQNNVPRNADYEIDLSKLPAKTVVCTLSIIDPDPSPPENFIVEVFLGNIQQQYFNNYVGRTFSVAIKPDTTKTRDTLYVNVTDMNGNKKNLTDVIYYGN